MITAGAIAFSPDGSLLAAVTLEGIFVWETATGKHLYSIEPPGFETRRGIDRIRELVFSPDGTELLSAAPITLRLISGS